jgi:hypothetical protein
MLAAAGGSLVAISLRFQVEIYVPSSKSSGSFSFLSPPTISVNKISSRAVADTYLGQLSNGAEYGPAARARAEGSQCRSQSGVGWQVRATPVRIVHNANDPTHRLVHRIFSEYIGRVSLPARSGRRRCIGDLDLNVRPEALAVCALTLVGKCPHCRCGRHTPKLALPGECWPRGNAPQRQATTYRRSRNAC